MKVGPASQCDWTASRIKGRRLTQLAPPKKQVLSRIPILAGRQRSKVGRPFSKRECVWDTHAFYPAQPITHTKGRRHWIHVNGAGVQLREQVARVRGGEGAIDDRFLKTHIHK